MAQGDYSTGWEEGWLAQQERNEKILQEARSVLGSDDLGPLYQTEPQSPAARVIPSWLPLAAYGTGLALGESKPLSGIGDMLTPNVNSAAMEGPMRFAGRGIPRNEGHYYHDPGLPGPVYPIEVDPTPRFPIHPGGPPISIWETSPDGGPRRGSRGGRGHIKRPIIPEVVYPEAATEIGQEVIGVDTRSEWEKWRDSFKEDWAVRK